METGRKAKRLRGWQRQKVEAEVAAGEAASPDPWETGLGSDPCEKDQEPSALSTRLLELWCKGLVSATMVADLARCATLDGAGHPELVALGQAGSFSRHKGNISRDLLRLLGKRSRMTPAHLLKVQCLDPKSGTKDSAQAAMMLPHVVFAELGQFYPDEFHAVFATSGLASFWDGVEGVQDDRLDMHPIALDKRVQKKDRTIPLYIHADGVEYQQRDSLMCWSWGSLLNQKSSLDSHLHMAVWPKSATSEDTWTPMYELMRWSFEALLKGFHPTAGPNGEPVVKEFAKFAEDAGKPLFKGYRAVIWSIQGDQDFYSNVLHLPHWNNKFPCFECDCQRPVFKKQPCPLGKSVKELRWEKQSYEHFDTAAALRKGEAALGKGGHSHPLFSIPGVTTRLVRHDALHVVYGKGVGSHLLGSLLHYLCYYEGKGATCSVPPAQRLGVVFSEVQKVYQANKTACRLTNLRLSMFCDPLAPYKSHPFLGVKAAELKHLAPALLPVLKSLLTDLGKRHEQQMKQCLQAFCDLNDLFDQAPMFLSEEEYNRAWDLGIDQFCGLYADLHDWSILEERNLFHVVHKHHSYQHMILSSKDMNPRFHWNFRSEDYVGAMSRIAHSTAFGLKSTRISCKVAAKWKLLLHFQLTRPGFCIGKEEEEEDP